MVYLQVITDRAELDKFKIAYLQGMEIRLTEQQLVAWFNICTDIHDALYTEVLTRHANDQ
jgi:hypothetical protein